MVMQRASEDMGNSSSIGLSQWHIEDQGGSVLVGAGLKYHQHEG
jgi:hypothetical protein